MSLLSLIRTEHNKLKGVSSHPERAGRVHLVQQQGGVTTDFEELDAYADYAKVYQAYVWVHKAVSRIAENFAPLPVRVINQDNQAKSHLITDLLTNVNDTMNAVDLWQRWVVHHMLGGEEFQEVVDDARGRPVELWPRRPDQVGVRPDTAPERALYPRVAGYTFGDEKDLIPPERMIHTKFYNPLSEWRGLAPCRAIREGIVIDVFAQAWSKAFLKSGARPDYAVIAPQGITTSEKEALETALMMKFSGQAGWHRPIILEQGVTDIKTFSFAPKDIEWLEQRKFSRDEVGSIFGVPDSLMGWGPDTYDTETKVLAAMRAFWTLTMLTLINHRDTSLNHFFTRVRPLLKAGEKIATDLSSVGILQEDIGPKLEQAGKFFALGYAPNDINARLGLGMPETEAGKVGYLPVNLLPVGGASPLATAPKALAAPAKSKKGAVVYGSPEHEALWKSYAAQLVPHERVMQRALKKDFQRQQSEVLRNLRGDKGKMWAAAIRESVVKDVPLPSSPADLLDWAAEAKFLAENYLHFFEETAKDFGQHQLDTLGVDLTFDLRNPAVEPAIRQMSIKFANDINQTTQDQIAAVLRDVLAEADAEGWGIPRIQQEIYGRISTVFDVRKSDYETERIARTEMNKAANKGNIEGMRQSGVVEKKGWLAALDDRTRDTHMEAHERYDAEPIALDAMFQVGADMMDAPGGGSLPEENISCRCTSYAAIE